MPDVFESDSSVQPDPVEAAARELNAKIRESYWEVKSSVTASDITEPAVSVPSTRTVFPSGCQVQAQRVELEPAVKPLDDDWRLPHSYRIQFGTEREKLPQLLDYFSFGQNRQALEDRVQPFLSRAPVAAPVSIPLEVLLPAMPRQRAHAFYVEPTGGDDGPNCYNTARNFFRADVQPRGDGLPNLRPLLKALLSLHYEEVPGEVPREVHFGDILYRPGHVARVLFRDSDDRLWVFQKASGQEADPFQIVPSDVSFSGEAHYYRRVR